MKESGKRRSLKGLEEIMAENFSNWAKYINLQIKLECIPKRIIPKSTLNHVTVKFLKTKDTEKNLKNIQKSLNKWTNILIQFLLKDYACQKKRKKFSRC